MSLTTVMLIENDLLIRSPLAAYLRDCGFTVIEAFDTAEARTILESGHADIDTILLDADGPGGETGFMFRSWMRTTHPHVTVILAGNVEKAAEKAGTLCAEGPALYKPYDHKLVLQEIRRQLAARHAPEE